MGCADGLDGLLKTGPSDPGLACPNNLKSWDLGTGRSWDIARLAPDFFSGVNGASRYRTLKPNVPGLTEIKPTIVGGVDGFEFLLPEPAYRIRALTTDAGVLLLATAGQCAHLKARERCVDDLLRTEVDASEKISCLGPASVEGDHVFIALEGSQEKQKLVLGEPLLVRTKRGEVSFDIFVPGQDKSAGHVSRQRDDTRDPLLSELFALLKLGGLEKTAMFFYRDLPEGQKTAQLDEKVVQLRAAGAKRVVAQYDQPAQLVELIRLHTMNAMPGDDQVFEVVAARIRDVLPRLADTEVSDDDFKKALIAFLFYAKQSDQPLELSAVEAKYGPKLHSSWANSRDLQQAFATMFPESRFVEELQQRQAKEAEERRQQQARQAQDADEQAMWEEVQSRGDEIAALAYRIQFGNQNFAKTRHNARGLAAMQKYREGLVRDAFCPAVRAFVKAKGTAEYSRRSTVHCKESAPTDVGVGGVEKTLTAECKVAFATGC
jgi:hypothetical protein